MRITDICHSPPIAVLLPSGLTGTKIGTCRILIPMVCSVRATVYRDSFRAVTVIPAGGATFVYPDALTDLVIAAFSLGRTL
jgi:hypothetical protein